jgi:hypothetical protein
MITFKKINLEDRDLLAPLLPTLDNRDCNLSFVNLYSWQFLTDASYAFIGGTPVLRLLLERTRTVYILPPGGDDSTRALQLLIEEDRQHDRPTRLFGIIPRLAPWLDEAFPGAFRYHANRDYFDYLYLRRDLVELRGKYLQAKRNHVNKFLRTYAHEYLPLTPSLAPECLQLEEEWCLRHGDAPSESLRNERQAMTLALNHVAELQLLGGAIRVNGKLVAFAYGAPVTTDTFGIHIEKADASIGGAYNMINQELARRVPEHYTYINREEDLGIPGLRQAKGSYHPYLLLEKGVAEYHP